MNVIIDLKNVAAGPYFLVSGKTKPDKYRFQRVPGQAHIHRLVIPGDKAAEVLDDMALRTQQIDIPVNISFQIEDSDLDVDAALGTKQAEIERLTRELAATHEVLRITEAKVNAPVKGGARRGPSEEQLDMLVERDDLLRLLIPFAGDTETPVEVLTRVIEAAKVKLTVPAPETPAPEAAKPAAKPRATTRPSGKKRD